jgi:hypothetical protein
MWLQMVDAQEFALRLSSLGVQEFTVDDVVDLATEADIRINADLAIDADVAQRLLDRVSPAVPVTPPAVFSSPGAVDGPAEQPTRPRRSGPGRTGRRPDSRRTGR